MSIIHKWNSITFLIETLIFGTKTFHAYLDRYVIELIIPFEVPFNFLSVEYVNQEA